MNRKVALIKLIEASVLVPPEEKIALLEAVPGLTDRQVEALGKFFATERQFVLEHEQEIRSRWEEILVGLSREQVYVGSSTQ